MKYFWAVVIVAIGALSWWLARPVGELRVAVEESASDLTDEIVKNADTALARTTRIARAFSVLQLKRVQGASDNPTPGGELDQAFTLGDLVKFELAFDLNYEKIVTFKGNLDVNNILEAMYEPVGFFDYYLAFKIYEKNPESSNEIRTVVRLYPLDPHGFEIPRSGFVNADAAQSRISFYIIEQILSQNKTRNCRKELCIGEVSRSLVSLEKTVDAFDLLFKGRSHPSCPAEDSDAACLGRSRDSFEAALAQDPGNAHARFGLGLLQIREARDSLSRDTAVTVGRKFMEGVANIAAARAHSDYLRGLMSTTEWQARIRETEGYENLGVTNAFIESADNYRKARAAFVEAAFSSVLQHLDAIVDPPAFIVPHLQNLRLSAQLMETNSREVATQLLEEFRRLEHDESDGTWHATFGLQLCRWSEGDHTLQQEAINHLRDAIRYSPPQLVAQLDRRAQLGICYGLARDGAQALKQFREVQSELPKNMSEEFRQVYYNLGVGFSVIEEMALASQYLGYAVDIDGRYYEGIKKLKELQNFRMSRSFSKWQVDHAVPPN